MIKIILIICLILLFVIIGIVIFLVLRYFKITYKNNLKLSIVLLLTALFLFTLYKTYQNIQPNTLVIKENYIEFKGNYGKKIPFEAIQNIQQLSLRPQIKNTIKGFSLWDIQKGTFKTLKGETVYLLLNGNHKPLLKVTLKNNTQLFFNSGKSNPEEAYEKLQNIFSYQKRKTSF